MTTETVTGFVSDSYLSRFSKALSQAVPYTMPRVSACGLDAPLAAVHPLGWIVSVLKDDTDVGDIQSGGSALRRWNDAYLRYWEVYGENASPPSNSDMSMLSARFRHVCSTIIMLRNSAEYMKDPEGLAIAFVNIAGAGLKDAIHSLSEVAKARSSAAVNSRLKRCRESMAVKSLNPVGKLPLGEDSSTSEDDDDAGATVRRTPPAHPVRREGQRGSRRERKEKALLGAKRPSTRRPRRSLTRTAARSGLPSRRPSKQRPPPRRRPRRHPSPLPSRLPSRPPKRLPSNPPRRGGGGGEPSRRIRNARDYCRQFLVEAARNKASQQRKNEERLTAYERGTRGS
jgi:hypothetical protein